MCLIDRAHLAQTQTDKHAQIYGQTDTEKQTQTDRQADRHWVYQVKLIKFTIRHL